MDQGTSRKEIISDPLLRSEEGPAPRSIVLDAERSVVEAFSEDANKGVSMLFRLYYAPLCSHALRFVSSKAIAEDLVSDIFFEFHTQELYRNIQTSFRAYLFTATRHRAFDYVRKEMIRNTSLDHAATLSVSEYNSPDSITQYEELYQDFQQAIHAMPLKRRTIYMMNRLEGKNRDEIARELAVSTRTVEAHLYQAFRQLRDALRAKWLMLLFYFTLY